MSAGPQWSAPAGSVNVRSESKTDETKDALDLAQAEEITDPGEQELDTDRDQKKAENPRKGVDSRRAEKPCHRRCSSQNEPSEKQREGIPTMTPA